MYPPSGGSGGTVTEDHVTGLVTDLAGLMPLMPAGDTAQDQNFAQYDSATGRAVIGTWNDDSFAKVEHVNGDQIFDTEVIDGWILPTPNIGQDIIFLSSTDIWDDSASPGTKIVNGGHIKTWNDRAGHFINPTNATSGNQPLLATNVLTGENAVQFVRASSHSLSATLSAISISAGITVISEYIPTSLPADNSGYSGIMSSSAINMILNTINGGDITTTGNVTSYVSADWYTGLVFGASPRGLGQGFMPMDRPSIQVSRLGAGQAALTRINGHTITAASTTASTGQTITGLTIGSWSSTYYLDGYAFRYRIFNSALTIDQIAVIERDMCRKKRYWLPSLLIHAGDSLTAGYKGLSTTASCTPADLGSVSGKTYPGILRTQLAVDLLANWEVSNVGVSGYHFSDMTPEAAAQIIAHYNPNRENNIVLLMVPISNEISQGNTDDQIVQHTVDYCTLLRNTGFKVGVMSQPRPSDPAINVRLDLIRARFAADHSFCDEYQDVAADSRLQAAGGTEPYFIGDGLHLNDYGDGVLASHAFELLQRLLRGQNTSILIGSGNFSRKVTTNALIGVTATFSGNITASGNVIAPNLTEEIGVIYDGNGSVLVATNSKIYRQIEGNYTINSYTILGDASGSIAVTLKKSTYAGFPTTADITGGANIVLATAQKNTDSTLTGWTTSLSSGDVLEFAISGTPATVTRISVVLKVTKR